MTDNRRKGAIVTGLVLAAMLCFVVARRYRRDDLRHVRRASAGEILRSLVVALPALILPILITGSSRQSLHARMDYTP